MENRTALRGARISRWLIAVFAVIVVIGLGVMSAYLANSVKAPAATQTHSTTMQGGFAGKERDDQLNTNPSGTTSSKPVDSFDGSGHGYVP
jgi:hypothetical protein